VHQTQFRKLQICKPHKTSGLQIANMQTAAFAEVRKSENFSSLQTCGIYFADRPPLVYSMFAGFSFCVSTALQN
jgi:hypothetical protein